MKTSVLGKSSKRIIKSGINLLDNISRIKEDINHGLDIWNVYDFMYLDKNKIPALNVLEISIPSKSDFIIESKSMKLYLNSFYNCLLYTSPSPRDTERSRMPSSA